VAVTSESRRTEEATDLLQHLIRNQCVNDGSAASGHEQRSADLLSSYLEGTGADIETFEPQPGRTSLVAKIEGSDPTAPSLTLLGHTDVVPANGDDWRHDPFGGELIDGEVWGRGAIDMLNLTATMATGFRHLALSASGRPVTSPTSPSPTRRPSAPTAPEWLCQNAADAVNADYVITESGGFPHGRCRRHTPRLPVIVGEKGVFWCRAHHQGNAGPREPAPPDRQCPGQGGRGGPAHRRLPAPGPAARGVDPLHRGHRVPARDQPSPCSIPTASTPSAMSSRMVGWPARPTPAPTPPWPPPSCGPAPRST
jgi:acetylornithine deacetylase/succinyl-diaminopimelate desuccinylase-like protein